MKKIYLIITVLLTIIILSGCGHFGEGDPVGITGGGNGGYGENSNTLEPINLNSVLILGEWKRISSSYRYYIWSFEPNGVFKETEYYYGDVYDIDNGTYEIINNQNTYDQLKIEYDNGYINYYYFEIRDNILYLYYNEGGDIYRIYERVVD